ncbi:MAG: AbrB/MazE/SpoVT family DNA-binding domain-containing protein [Ignavibacteriaceae bacterium]|nr:AbrB/MazE/SpoVT family DNA-binding domain-containing protein [Ignavibacteriaceae bacterium]
MKTKIIKIGNSRGIRIPKTFIEQSRLKGEVELEIEDDKIIIRPIVKDREKWEAAFRKMANNNDDALLDKASLSEQSRWDNEEWEW